MSLNCRRSPMLPRAVTGSWALANQRRSRPPNVIPSSARGIDDVIGDQRQVTKHIYQSRNLVPPVLPCRHLLRYCSYHRVHDMGEPNIFISNGTCYSAPGRRLDDSFIPCGNTAFGHFTCCGAGDNCLANNACWGVHGTGYGSSLTYLAGCTDPEYKDPSCPKKEFGKFK